MHLNYSFFSIISIFLYIYFEIFSTIINYSIFKNTKSYIINYSKKKHSNLNVKNILYFFLNLLLLYTLLLKTDFMPNNVLSVTVFYIIILKTVKNYIDSNFHFLMFNVVIFLLMFKYVNSFITFFLFIELYSIIFYFFFITNNQSKNINILQYKNMLLLYLFNNFFSTMLYLIGMYYILVYYGTLNFNEINYLYKKEYLGVLPLIISFIIKISLPGFHFLKIEVYKYLTYETIIVYSIITLFLNYVLLTTFFHLNIVYFTLSHFKVFNFLIIFGALILIHKLKLNNFHEFIAYSGFSSNILIVINYIIKLCVTFVII